MKKLLALLGCISISVSIMGVTSCTYINFYKKSLTNKIDELVEVSATALMGPISGAAGTDGEFANSRVLTNKISKYSNLKNSSVTSNMLKSFFGENFDIFSLINSGSIKGISKEDAPSFSGTSFSNNIWKTIDGFYNVIYGVVGEGFSTDLVSILVNTISGLGLTEDIASTVDKVLQNFSLQNLNNYFSNKINLVTTNRDSLLMFYSELIDFLGGAVTNGDTGENIININDYSLSTLISKGNTSYSDAMKLIIEAINKIVSAIVGGDVSWNFDSTQFMNHIMTLIASLSLYMNSFDNLNNDELKNNPDKIHDANGNDTNLNYLFSSNENNYTVIKNNLYTKISNKPEKITDVSFEGFSNLINCFLNPQKLGKYQFERTLQMLFQSNEKTQGFRLISSPQKNDDTDHPSGNSNSKDGVLFDSPGWLLSPIPSSGDWISNSDKRNLGLTPLLTGVIDGVLENALGSLSKILSILGLGANQLGSVVGNLISSILADNDMSKLLNKAWVDIYNLKNNTIVWAILANFLNEKTINSVKTLGQKFSPMLKNTMSNLFFGKDNELEISNLFSEVFEIKINEATKNSYRNLKINSLKTSTFSISNLIGSLPNIILGLLSIASTVKLVDSIQNITDISNIVIRDGNNSSVPVGEYDSKQNAFVLNGLNYTNTLSLAFALMDNNRSGYKVINNKTGIKSTPIQFAESILGYVATEDGQGKITDNTLFATLVDLFNGENGIKTKKILSTLKEFLDNKSDSFVNNENSIVDAYLNKNNFKISDINWTNFEDKGKKSTLTYTINYSHDSKTQKYKIEIYLDPTIDRYYHFDSIEKI